ncbi:MAG: flagellar motor switch protein FliN [Dehalococcoidia bacterium]|nr:flagellar motor switch protein FliN [Dehalococcoidia bacterium]
MAGEQDPLGEVLGPAAEALSALAPVLREKVLTGLESLTGTRPSLREVSFSTTDVAGLSAEVSATDHLGMDLSMSEPSGGRHRGAAFVSLADAGTLLSVETGAERMADADFARAQMEMISAAVREFFDLMTMTLFIDDLRGIEVVPAPARVGDASEIVAAVVEAAAGEPVVRVDLSLGLGAEVVAMVLLAPQRFLDAFAETPSAAPDAADFDSLEDLVSLATGTVEDATGHADAGMDNISTLRPAGTFGAGAREDVDVHPVRFPPLSDVSPISAERRSLDLIMDVSMRVTVELGRSTLTVEEVLSLGPGSVVELNKLAGEPVDVLVNEQLIARGEVVVVDENFGVRVTEIVSPRRRAQAMGA